MATPITLPTGNGYSGFYDCSIVTPRPGSPPNWPDAAAREMIAGQYSDEEELAVVPANPPFKTIQFVSSQLAGTYGGVYHPGILEFWTWITSNPSLWNAIPWGGVYGTLWYPYGDPSAAWLTPDPAFAGNTSMGTPTAPGVYGCLASGWEFGDGASVIGSGTFELYGHGSASVSGAVVLVASPTITPRNFTLWQVSEDHGDLDSYPQSSVGAGTLTPAAPFLIPLPYAATPGTPPSPVPPLDLTDYNTWDRIGVVNYFAWS